MRPTHVLAALVGLCAPPSLVSATQLSEAEALLVDLNNQAIETLESSATLDTRANGKCSIFGASVRRDW